MAKSFYEIANVNGLVYANDVNGVAYFEEVGYRFDDADEAQEEADKLIDRGYYAEVVKVG